MERGFIVAVKRLITSRNPSYRKSERERVRALIRRGCVTFESLLETTPKLDDFNRDTAVALLGSFNDERGVPILLNVLQENPASRFEAARSLAQIDGDQAKDSLIDLMRSDEDVDLRYWAAYSLSCMENAGIQAFIDALTDVDEQPKVRAQAAEGLGNLLQYHDRRTRVYRLACQPLIAALADESAEVRFWATFALGLARCSAALPALEQLRLTDDAVCPGYSSVQQEASWAIEVIMGKDL